MLLEWEVYLQVYLSTFYTVSQFILEWWLLHIFAELLCKHIGIKIKISCSLKSLFHVALIMHSGTFFIVENSAIMLWLVEMAEQTLGFGCCSKVCIQ